MPLHSITLAVPRTAKLETNDTPAELPSGRVRFSDELGRETALAARRERAAASRASTDSATAPAKGAAASVAAVEAQSDVAKDASPAFEADRSADTTDAIVAPGDEPDLVAVVDPAPLAADRSAAAPVKTKTPRTAERSAAGSVAPSAELATGEKQDDVEIALALAQFGLAVPAEPPSEPVVVPAPDAPFDPMGTRLVAENPLTAVSPEGEAGLQKSETSGTALAALPATGGSDSTAALAIESEPRSAHDAEPAVAHVAAHAPPPTFDLAGFLATPAAAHAAGGTAPVAAPALKAPDGVVPGAARVADLLPRVALSDLPRALPALLDGLEPQMRLGRRGKNWEVEMRLDPPELGSLHVRFELQGDSIRGVIQCEPQVERLLGPVLKELEDHLNQQRGGASFDLSRHAKQEEERPWAPRDVRTDAVPFAAAAQRAASRKSDPSRLVDVTA